MKRFLTITLAASAAILVLAAESPRIGRVSTFMQTVNTNETAEAVRSALGALASTGDGSSLTNIGTNSMSAEAHALYSSGGGSGSWTNLTDIPAGFADGEDNVGAGGDGFPLASDVSGAFYSISDLSNLSATGTVSSTYLSGSGQLVTNLMRIVNVRDFGAVGDGSADDTAPLLAALTKAQGGYPAEDLSIEATLKTNSWLYIPAGKYRYTQVLEITNAHMGIIGQGYDRSVLLPDPGVWGLTITNSALDVTLRDFTIQGSGIGDSAVGLFVGSAVGPWWNPGAPGQWPIDVQITIKDFEIGSIFTQTHNTRAYNSIYGCRIALIATNVINGSEFGGFYNRYTDTAAVIGGWYNSKLVTRHWDPQVSTGGSNVVKIVAGINNCEITGRTEMHHPNAVGIRFTGASQVNNLKIHNSWFDKYAGATNGWALYFEDAYTNSSGQSATIDLDNCRWTMANPTYGGHIRLPVGSETLVRMKQTGGFDQPEVSVFDASGGALVFRTNYTLSHIEQVYNDWSAYVTPNATSNRKYSHNLYVRRPATNGADELWYNYYTGSDLTVDKVNLLKLPILDKVGGVALTNKANTFTSGQTISSGDTFLLTLANTNANGVDKFVRVGSETYNTALNDLATLMSQSTVDTANLYIGGGTAAGTPYEKILFYTGESTANGSGSHVVGIYQDGGVGIGSAASAPSDPGDGNLRVVGTGSFTNYATPTNNPIIGDGIVATSTTGATKWGVPRQVMFLGGSQNIGTTMRTPSPYFSAPMGGDAPTLVSRTLVFTNLYLRFVALNSGTNVTVTLYTNGTATPLVATVNGVGGAAEGNSGTTFGVVQAGSYWSWRTAGNNSEPGVAHTIGGSVEVVSP